MAKFVVAGKANCPYYAKAELLADYLQKNLPDFRVFKIVQSPDDWQPWLQALCQKNGWVHHQSPIIWRELVDRGGKGLLLGGFNDFMEYAQGYYGFTSDMMTTLMLKIAKENLKTNQSEREEEAFYRIHAKPMAVWISGALCAACTNLIPTLLNGQLFGHSQELSLHLLHIDGSLSVLQGLQMEIEDMAWPLLRKVTVQNTLRKAFMDAEIIIVLDDLVPEKGQSIEDCYREMAGLYQEIAIKIDTFAKPSARVLVAGDYILNLKTYLLMDSAYAIDHENFIAVSTQLEGEAKALLARRLNVNPMDVKDVIVWGNIGRSTFIDLHKARVHQYESAIWGPPEFSRPVLEMLHVKNWIEEEFVEELHTHRSKIQAALKHHLGISTTIAIYNVLNWWYHDSPPGEFVSLGVVSQGDFGIPSGLIFSVPVRFCGGKWVIQSQIEISEETKDKLKDIVQELKMEHNFNFSHEKETEAKSNFLPGLEGKLKIRSTDRVAFF
ncbi:putative malate dehydrogenase 1B isoform X1 [Stegostoma tigrinum]|uniref:putative malate dehydrogenase 1B isoform X1 n=1 Tax=Stegostoma tigrinum TaxID=3053191 RepID=UPI00202B13EE|nr:putative malate dehydrogenase 1B isoform X1 [Stegostoma tigrinum]XP_048391126.1 putative malate dehydrogenase 1B isoform X1 [Stegostoma tigrinum]